MDVLFHVTPTAVTVVDGSVVHRFPHRAGALRKHLAGGGRVGDMEAFVAAEQAFLNGPENEADDTGDHVFRSVTGWVWAPGSHESVAYEVQVRFATTRIVGAARHFVPAPVQ